LASCFRPAHTYPVDVDDGGDDDNNNNSDILNSPVYDNIIIWQ
jgi:hypothetical protein